MSQSFYEDLHLKDPLPGHEPERFRRAAELYEKVIRRGKARGFTGIYSREDLARARRNIERLPWAREMFEEVVRDADFWVQKSDEEFYATIPTQNPLALTPAQYHGFPIHGGNRSNLGRICCIPAFYRAPTTLRILTRATAARRRPRGGPGRSQNPPGGRRRTARRRRSRPAWRSG